MYKKEPFNLSKVSIYNNFHYFWCIVSISFFEKMCYTEEKTDREMEMNREIIIPNEEYFGYGNLYSGSRKTFNYKISPKDEMLQSIVWYGKLCSDKSKAVAEVEYPLDENGICQLQDWLNEQYAEYVKNHHE